MLRWRFYVPSAIVSSGELEDLGAEDLKGHCWASASLAVLCCPMLRAASMLFMCSRPNRACRSRRRTRNPSAPLVEGKELAQFPGASREWPAVMAVGGYALPSDERPCFFGSSAVHRSGRNSVLSSTCLTHHSQRDRGGHYSSRSCEPHYPAYARADCRTATPAGTCALAGVAVRTTAHSWRAPRRDRAWLTGAARVRLRRLPRMADFAFWATACEGAFRRAGTFLSRLFR